jgi:hypothetical protein
MRRAEQNFAGSACSRRSRLQLSVALVYEYSCTQAWPPSSIILGTIVFRALGNRASPSHRATSCRAMWAVPLP